MCYRFSQILTTLRSSGDGTVKPSVHSFAMTINAWSNVGSETAAHNAEEILKRLLEDYDEALEQDTEYAKELKPNNVVFNSVIDAWARSGSNSAGEKAESILLRMEGLSKIKIYDVRPDTITFNTCSKLYCDVVSIFISCTDAVNIYNACHNI